MSLDSLLVDTVRVRTISHSQDAGGGDIRTPVPGAVVNCNVQCQAGSRDDKNARVGSVVHADIYFSADPGLGTTDQLEWLTSNGLSKADGAGKYPLITVDSPAVDRTSRGVFKVTGSIKPVN